MFFSWILCYTGLFHSVFPSRVQLFLSAILFLSLLSLLKWRPCTCNRDQWQLATLCVLFRGALSGHQGLLLGFYACWRWTLVLQQQIHQGLRMRWKTLSWLISPPKVVPVSQSGLTRCPTVQQIDSWYGLAHWHILRQLWMAISSYHLLWSPCPSPWSLGQKLSILPVDKIIEGLRPVFETYFWCQNCHLDGSA